MSDKILHIKSITQLHEVIGYEKPFHPLISMMDATRAKVPDAYIGMKVTTDFYTVIMKDGNCGLQYGRGHYDFEEGFLTFTGPQQVFSVSGDSEVREGWMLFFHPDLIRGTHLAEMMDRYTFFSYSVNEALHLSDKEQSLLNDIVVRIESEYKENIDEHSRTLFVSHLELLLNYCMRFYKRQFHTRQHQNADILERVERLLRDYYQQGQQQKRGTPTIQYLADHVHLSPNYLSDLLRKETGRTATDHINAFLVEKAKTLLLSGSQNVGEIAYDLGFNYPHYFSRLFKQHTGMTPKQYRETDLN